MLRLSRSFDVYSMNSYAYEVDREVLEKVYEITGRPIIIGEFHFGVPANGLAAGLVQVNSEAERGVAYRYYVEQAAAFPALIGTSWFQWIDQPATGRMDGENYNIGLLDVTDRPYKDFLSSVVTTHKNLYTMSTPESWRPSASERSPSSSPETWRLRPLFSASTSLPGFWFNDSRSAPRRGADG